MQTRNPRVPGLVKTEVASVNVVLLTAEDCSIQDWLTQYISACRLESVTGS